MVFKKLIIFLKKKVFFTNSGSQSVAGDSFGQLNDLFTNVAYQIFSLQFLTVVKVQQ